jgi:hypothetical protein
VTAGTSQAFPSHNFHISTFVIKNKKNMPPHSDFVDIALDVLEAEDFSNASISSDMYLPNLPSFKKSQGSLASAARKQQKKVKSSVRFDEYDEVFEVRHINEFSEKKINRLWWSQQEQSEIREACLDLVRRFNAGEVMDKEEMLGLEKQTNDGAEPVKRLRRAVNETVFILQEADQVTSSARPRTSLISEFYQKSCAKPVLEARRSASQLAVEVKIETGILYLH